MSSNDKSTTTESAAESPAAESSEAAVTAEVESSAEEGATSDGATPSDTAPPAGEPRIEDLRTTEVSALTGEPTEAEPAGDKSTEGESAEDTSSGAQAAEGESAESGRRRGITIRTPLLAGLGVLLVLSLGAAITFGLLYKHQSDVDTARSEALATARSYAATVTGYDHKNLSKNFSDSLDGATGEFRDQYAGASKTLRQMIKQAKATAKGDVLDAGVKSASTDRVEVTLFVDQSVTNAAVKKPRIDRSRVLMTLEKHDDRWLVSKLQMI